MNDAEVDAFLRSQSTAVVVGSPVTGSPDGAVGRLHYEGGFVAFTLRADDAVVTALAADDRACCIVEQFPSYYEIVGVMLHGRATRRQATRPGEATFALHVDKVVSFDFGKLDRSP